MTNPPTPVPPPVPPALPPQPPPLSGAAPASDRIVAAMKSVNWQQFGKDLITFAKRFASGDFARIIPEPHEQSGVAGRLPRMASLMVWRRALLMLACVLTSAYFVKSCFDPHTFRSQLEKAQVESQTKLIPGTVSGQERADEIKRIEAGAKAQTDQTVEGLGESNVNVINALMIGLWLSVPVSLVFQILAARAWSDWRRSRRMALIAVAVLLGPQLVAMLVPWGALMDFTHLEAQGAEQMTAMKTGIQLIVLFAVLMSALPFFYGLFNGVLRASLATKTLVPASIVCGWGSMLLAITISVPWFIMMSIVNQMQADALIVLGVVCLLAAPLSIVLKARRLGVSLSSEEATKVVAKAKLIFSVLNASGVLLLLSYLSEKDLVGADEVSTLVIHYFANLMLISVVTVDVLAMLLDRAHRKLASDPAPEEPLRQLGEVLPGA